MHRLLYCVLAYWLVTQTAWAEPSVSSRLSGPIRDQLASDMTFMRNLRGQGATPIFRDVFGGIYGGDTFSRFFDARINKIDADECDGGTAMVACVIYNLSPRIIWLTDNYAKFNMPQIFRISVLLHESRHGEYDYRYHATCPIPFRDSNGKDVVSIFSGIKLEGRAACDTSATASYGVQVEFLKNTQLNCSNCNEKVILDAELYGDDGLKRIIDPSEYSKLRNDIRR